MKPILVFLVLFLSSTIHADSAIQTDWSGGGSVPGPVQDWGTTFSVSSYVEIGLMPGCIVLEALGWLEHTIASGFDGASNIYPADIDADGDVDVAGAAMTTFGSVCWWENEDGLGELWSIHIVDSLVMSPASVCIQDIDGDSSLDVLAASLADEIAWWENEDGSGLSWIKHTVDDEFRYPRCACAQDIDNDGDMDVIGASDHFSPFNPDIAWWENLSGSGDEWLEHPIDYDFENAETACAADIDGDGDIDILSSSLDIDLPDELAWWENADGTGGVWIRHSICNDLGATWAILPVDIDNDTDIDVVNVQSYPTEIVWRENNDGSGTSWTKHTIDSDFNNPRAVQAADFDMDGDRDILVASWAASDDDGISWWENADGSGSAWIEYPVDSLVNGVNSVFPAELDGDGIIDVIGASDQEDMVTWWRLRDYAAVGYLESSILDTEVSPDWDFLEWNHDSPNGTSITFQVRASSDHLQMGEWSEVISYPCILDGILADGDQYVQYMVILETTNHDSTPALFDITLSWDPMGIEGEGDPPIVDFLPFTPNPTSSPVVRFKLPESGTAGVRVYDLTGRLVYLKEAAYPAGYHNVMLDDLTPGIYFCRMTLGDFTATQRFIVIE